jgi:hypothetical protein
LSTKKRKRESDVALGCSATWQGHGEQALDRYRSMTNLQGEWAGGSLRRWRRKRRRRRRMRDEDEEVEEEE